MPKMTPAQEAHLTRINNESCDLADVKYRKGQAEHGGNLFDLTSLQLADMAIEEAIDQVVYLITLRDKLRHPGQTNIVRNLHEGDRFIP
jgi:hypothetical protein